MAAYLIAQHKITDRAVFEEFRSKAIPLIESRGGRFIVRSEKVEVREGDWAPDMVVVIEFPDREKLRLALDSPEFQKLRELRRKSGSGVVLVVEGE
ncbi:DUF1330 domain-containing protein [Methylobacterium nodulans]|uniref:DUF1330 domain-containing protein n=1 Tax=Methylobacterium nodulans (strain LMG 21967 / CNCM I-2342 / ORS 2060) TaxID=460265 RepID=B8IER4_METNO|nr:DUF1330 domain-containing protein [Methylobacterium nodulans]ACL61407.1 protein of unknown function DUF1330 [Methylobacterium nodulans ORS 2060]